MKADAKSRGSITIYLLLSLVLVMGLICMLTESARVCALHARLRSITFMAADSCFAEYSREIFDQYGIMALWKTPAQLTASVNGYIQKNLDMSDLDLYRDADLLPARHEGTALLDIQFLTDDQGNVFLDQVCEYMQYHLVQDFAQEIISRLDLFRSGSQIAGFVDKINSYREVFLKVGTIVDRIQSASDQLKSLAGNPKTLLGNMETAMQRYSETENPLYVAEFNVNYWNLKYKKNKMESSYTEDTLEAIQAQMELLEKQTSETGEDSRKVERNARLAELAAAQLNSLDSLFGQLGQGLSAEEMPFYSSAVSSFSSAFTSFRLDDLGLDTGLSTVRRENTGFLSTVGDIFSKGLLKAVTNRTISAAKADTSEFPSVTVYRKSFSLADGLFDTGYRKLVSVQYVLKHFGNFAEPVEEETALRYETEYILCGKSSDEANLKETVREMTLLRSALNMVSFFKDAEKMQEARTLALAIAGFTGMEALVETARILVISVWCLAEALCDMKTLMAGGKVAVVKAPQEWTVSAVGLKNFSKTVIPSATDSQGWGYPDYLQILLLKENLSTQAYRCMDLIQANVCKNFAAAFRMKDCINRVDLQVDFAARQLFSSFLFVKNLAQNGSGSYGFRYLQSYTY